MEVSIFTRPLDRCGRLPAAGVPSLAPIEARLDDGSRVTIRPIQADDKARLAAAFDGLSPESRVLRFAYPKRELSGAELRYFTEVDQMRHVAYVAIQRDTDQLLGVARCIELPERPGTAEAAVVVGEAHRRLGLGSRLLARLATRARECGIHALRAQVSGENGAIREMMKRWRPRMISLGRGQMELEIGIGLEDPG